MFHGLALHVCAGVSNPKMSTAQATLFAMLNRWRLSIIASGLVLGIAATVFIPSGFASRNSSGSYSLPAGNPVVAGTTISTSWANNTMTDIATELTNSLDRAGRGAMTGPLQLGSGSCAAPSLTFSADTDVGMYRSGTNETRMCVASTAIQHWTTTGAVFPLVLTAQRGAVVTTTATDGNGVTATGNGNGSGVLATGGANGANGVLGYGGTLSGTGVNGNGGSPNGTGMSGAGDGTGTGIRGVGGDVSGYGGHFTGGAPNGDGAFVEGTGTGNAINIGPGHAKFSGSNPLSTTAFQNTLTPSSLIKAWALVTSNGVTNSISKGFNIASVATDGSSPAASVITLAQAMDSANYAVFITDISPGAGTTFAAELISSTTFRVRAEAGGASIVVPQLRYSVMVLGLQ